MAADELGVDREGLNYRAGWCEALKAFGYRVQFEGVRAPKKTIAGLERASQIAKAMYDDMIAKMRATGKKVQEESE